MRSRFLALLLLGHCALGAFADAQETTQSVVDPDLPNYQAIQGVAGTLNSNGSDTLNNLMTFWAESFRDIYPNVNIQIEGKGSSTAPIALTAGTAQIGPMSRMMMHREIDAFERRHGFPPTPVAVAIDALAIYVNADNPVESLSLPEVDAIFSITRRSGYSVDITTWGQVGLEGPWANRPMSLYGRNSASGTYGYFKEKALYGGDFRATVKEQPGSASVVMGISEEMIGIGYSGIGYRTSAVKALALANEIGEAPYEAAYDNIVSGDYPLSRLLYVYVAKKPGEPLPLLLREFLRMVLSRQGQADVLKDGYLPLPADVAARQLTKLEIE